MTGAAAGHCRTSPARYTARVIRNVIFDWSGTLVDDLPAVLDATNHVLRLAGRPEVTREQFRAEFCLPFTLFYDRHVPDVPLPRLERWFHGRFKQVQDSVAPLPHAREFLEFCRARKLRTFVLSTVRPDHFRKQAARAGFRGFFDALHLGVRDKRHKIGALLKTHALVPGETVFIGDMQHDVETARAGGVLACAVLTGYNGVTQLRQSGPDLIVEHLGELRALLERQRMELTPSGPRPEADAPPCQPVVTVGALVFNRAGEVLLVQTPKWSNLWGIPGGKVKWGETSVAALRRELLEETNLRVRDVKFALAQDCIHSREFYRDAHFLLLNYTCVAAGRPQVRLNEEARAFRWVTPAAAARLKLNQPTRVLLRAVTAAAKRTTQRGHPPAAAR